MKSPARTTGLYGPSGLLIAPTLLPAAAGRSGRAPYRRGRMNRRRRASPRVPNRAGVDPADVSHHVLATGVLAACGGPTTRRRRRQARTTPTTDPAGTDVAGPMRPAPVPPAATRSCSASPRRCRCRVRCGCRSACRTSDAVLCRTGPLDARGAGARRSTAPPVGDRIEAARRDAVPAPYYDFRPTIETPGFYRLRRRRHRRTVRASTWPSRASVSVPSRASRCRRSTRRPAPTPAGVDPICTPRTRGLPVPRHHAHRGIGRRQAGRRTTSARRRSAARACCAPGLESLIEVQPEFGDTFSFVHAEVYADTTATTLTPAVESLNARALYEPVLFITDAAGVVLERIDAVWNTRGEVLDRSRADPETARRSAEALAAPARAGGVRVGDGETGLVEAVLVVERGTFEQLRRRRIDDDLHQAVVAVASPAGRRRRSHRRRTSRTRTRCTHPGARQREGPDPGRLRRRAAGEP